MFWAENLFRVDPLAKFIGIFIVFFSFLTFMYSLSFMKGKKGQAGYYFYLFLTAISSLGVVFANHFVLFIVFWGFLGVLLYLLISFGETPRTAATAKKAMIIIGGSDAFMLLGIALIWSLTGSFAMDKIPVVLDNHLAVAAFLFLIIGVFAKAGVMPFHTWVPDTAEDAPAVVTAFLPASLDKLLGIYFLARLSLNIFELNPAAKSFLMAVGSFTIVAAVMMALVQHDFRRLLGYHAVSQVGYMVLGIGTGNPIGMAGGLFHMLNNAIYKSCLFLSSGAVEKKAGTTDLEKLGGLAKVMPFTFVTFFIAALAISGVPPLNGFVSKWMIYQGLIEVGKNGSRLWLLWLVAAMFGSALTLASFMKLVHAVFLGQPAKERSAAVSGQRSDVGPLMLVPMGVLAILCVLFGVFAYAWPLNTYIVPLLKEKVVFLGMWDASLAMGLIVVGLLIGFLIYLMGRTSKIRQTEAFVGGEDLRTHPEMRLSGTEFYQTIENVSILKTIYHLAKEKFFDVYDVGVKTVLGMNRFLKYLHNGVLSTYLAWCLLGMTILFLMFGR